MFKCVIFDLDGLIIDSERITREVYTSEGKKLGIDLDEEFFLGIIGTTKKASQAQFDRFKVIEDNLEIISKARFDSIYYEVENNPNFYKKGLYELLDYLTENNYKIAIATSSFLDYALKVISGMKKQYNFDAICTGDMVKNHKPNPDIFLLAANKLNVSPKECLVLEDSRNGILAAKNAKMSAGFIYDTVEPDKLIKSKYDYSFNSLDEVIETLKK